jgi:hypothetical protein
MSPRPSRLRRLRAVRAGEDYAVFWTLIERARVLCARPFTDTDAPPGGAFIIYDSVIDDRRVNSFGLLMSVNMLIEAVPH